MGGGVGARAIQATIALFERYDDPPLLLKQRPNILDVVPQVPHGYPVTLYDQGHRVMVAAERWHAKFDDPDQAAFCAMWLFTPFYRVVHEYKGGVLVATWLERYEATGWEGMDPVFFMNPVHEPSWRLFGEETYRRQYVQQCVIAPPRPYVEFEPEAALDEDGLPIDFREGRWSELGTEPQGIELY